MPTYLVALTVIPEDYGVLNSLTQNNISIRVFARKNAINAGFLNYALECAKKAVDFFENVYFDSALRAVPPKIGIYIPIEI